MEGAPSADTATAAVICPGRNLSAGCGDVNGKGTHGSSVARFAAVGVAGVAEAGADRQHAPPVVILHRRQLAETLHDGVVVDDDRRFVVVDERDIMANAVGE